jgi:O-antigen/teichoic acid export membrane protein
LPGLTPSHSAGGSDPSGEDRPPADRQVHASFPLSASWTFGTQVTAAVFSLGNVLIVSRLLGPRGRGEVAFLMAVSYLSSQAASLGVDFAAANIAGRSPERRRAVAGNTVVLSLVFGGLAIGALVWLFKAFPRVGPPVGPGLLALALAAIPVLILSTYLTRMVFADFGVGAVNASSLAPPVINLVANGALAVDGRLTVASAFTVWVLGQLVAAAVLALYLERRLAGFGRPDGGLAREMVSFGLKSYGGRVLQFGNYRLDQWLVGSLAGSRELGLYSVAVAWSESLFILPRALMEAQRPFLIRSDRLSAGAQAAMSFRVSTLLSTPLAVAVVVLAPFLCVTIFGPQFHGSIADLRILALGAFGIAAMKILGSALIAQERPLLEGLAAAVAFVATVALDLYFIPRHGGFGAALASTASYTLGGAAAAVIAARALHFPISLLWPRREDLREAGRESVSIARRVRRKGAESACERRV